MGNETTMAHLTTDIVVFAEQAGVLHVLLIERGSEPFAGYSALPGGYVDEGETFTEAASRELREETGLSARLRTVGIYDTPGRDPRGRVVSVAHFAVLPDIPTPTAGDDAREARWVPVADVLANSASLAFDHAEILRDACDHVIAVHSLLKGQGVVA